MEDDDPIIDLVDSPTPYPSKPSPNALPPNHIINLTSGFYTDDGEFYLYEDFNNKTNNKNTTTTHNIKYNTAESNSNNKNTCSNINNRNTNTNNTTTTTTTTTVGATNPVDRDVQHILQIFPDCDVEYLRSLIINSTSINRAQEITDSFLEKRDYKRAKVEEKENQGFSLDDISTKDYYNTKDAVTVLYADTWYMSFSYHHSLFFIFLSFFSFFSLLLFLFFLLSFLFNSRYV